MPEEHDWVKYGAFSKAKVLRPLLKLHFPKRDNIYFVHGRRPKLPHISLSYIYIICQSMFKSFPSFTDHSNVTIWVNLVKEAE